MRRFIVAGSLAALVLFPLSAYVFLKGAEWGIGQYKHSRQFYMTLDSMFKMGQWFACENKLCGR
jgi:hypothetical protein